MYWGLPRSLRFVLDNQEEKIYAPLRRAGIEYDTFFHTYTSQEPFASSWDRGDAPRQGDESLLRGAVIAKEDRDEALREIDVPSLKPPRDPLIAVDGLKHPFRSFTNFCLALRSRQKAWALADKLARDSGKAYSAFVFVRPDVRFRHSLNPSWILRASRDSSVVLSPNFQKLFGMNDRMAVCHPDVAAVYANAIDDLADRRVLYPEKRMLDVMTKRRIRNIEIPIFFWRVRGNNKECWQDMVSGSMPWNL